MRRLLSAVALSSLTYGGLLTPVHAEVNVNVSIGANEGYALGLSNYYGVPQDRISWLADEGLSYEEVTVALYIADLAGVDPFDVADLRLSGMSWMEVSHYYGLGADIYYIDDLDPIGSYTTYYEPFRSRDRGSWVSISLSDDAIVNLTNLRYASQLYGVPPRYVMDYRSRGDNFIVVNERLYREHGDIPRRRFSRESVRRQSLPQPIQVEAHERGAKVLKNRPARPHREGRNRQNDEQQQPQAGQNPGAGQVTSPNAPDTNPAGQPNQVEPGKEGQGADRNPGDRSNRDERGRENDDNRGQGGQPDRQADQPGRVEGNQGQGGQPDRQADQPGRVKENDGNRGQGGGQPDRQADQPGRVKENDGNRGQGGQPDRQADQPGRVEGNQGQGGQPDGQPNKDARQGEPAPGQEPRGQEAAPQPEPGKDQAPQPGKEAAPQPGKDQAPQPGKEAAPQPGKDQAPQPDQGGAKNGGGNGNQAGGQGQPHGNGGGKP